MEETKTKSKKWQWVAGLLLFLACCWLFANWPDFKEGFASGYAASTKSQP